MEPLLAGFCWETVLYEYFQVFTRSGLLKETSWQWGHRLADGKHPREVRYSHFSRDGYRFSPESPAYILGERVSAFPSILTQDLASPERQGFSPSPEGRMGSCAPRPT